MVNPLWSRISLFGNLDTSVYHIRDMEDENVGEERELDLRDLAKLWGVLLYSLIVNKESDTLVKTLPGDKGHWALTDVIMKGTLFSGLPAA